MRKILLLHVLWFVLLLLALSFVPRLQTTAAAPAQQGENLLENGGFEQPFVDGAANGWTRWHRETPKEGEDCLVAYHVRPRWNLETNGTFVNQGVASQYVGNNWDTWSGGLYQTIAATPGTTYRFSFFARGRTTNERSPEPSDFGINMNIRAGIDPNGSGAWNDADVAWSGAASPHDQWQQVTVEATASGDSITVFTSADLGVTGVNQCRQFLDTWYDNASLVAVAAAATNTPPPATAAPTIAATAPPAATEAPEVTEPTAEPTAEEAPTEEAAAPTATPEPETEPAGGGTICVNAFHDENANGQQEPNEGYMAGVTFTIANAAQVVGQAVSTGTETPACFPRLAPGPYQVAQEVPARLEMTTAANATIEVEVDKTVGLAFGSRIRFDDAGDGGGDEVAQVPDENVDTGEAASEAPEAGFDPVALSGLGVILVAVILLGVLLFVFLRR